MWPTNRLAGRAVGCSGLLCLIRIRAIRAEVRGAGKVRRRIESCSIPAKLLIDNFLLHFEKIAALASFRVPLIETFVRHIQRMRVADVLPIIAVVLNCSNDLLRSVVLGFPIPLR